MIDRQRLANAAEIGRDGKDPMTGEQAVDLKIELKERDEIDDAEQAEEQVAREEISRAKGFGSKQPAVDAIEAGAMIGDEPVRKFAEARKTRQVLVRAI